MIRLIALLAFFAPFAASAAEPNQGVGYGGALVQMQPIMVPYQSPDGTHFQVVTIRIQLPIGEKERPACFVLPYVHEKILMYLYTAKLAPADFSGQRRDLLAKKLLDLAIASTDRGYYTGLQIIDQDAPPLDPKSMTLSTQCG